VPNPDQSTFSLRDVWFVAYAPAIVSSTGHGAILPVLALRARELGADVSTAAVIVAMVAGGMLLASLPAGALIARIGERNALLAVGLLDAVAMAVAALTSSTTALGVAALLDGMAWTVFLMARQGFMIDMVPMSHRARAMALMGGSYRVGVLVGPLLGAGLIELAGIPAVFWLAAALALVSAALTGLMPDLSTDARADARDAGHLSVWSVARAHWRTLATLGVAVVVLSGTRNLRTSLLPLWADHIGLSASTVSLVFAFTAAIDLSFTWPGGWLMDTRGRVVTAVPVALSMAVACLLLPLAQGVLGLVLVMSVMAVGNGLGSGIVMTMGADTAPQVGRAQYLGAWRLCGDIGGSGAPLLVGALAAVAPLATAAVTMGVVALAGTAWVGYWTRRHDQLLIARGVRFSRR
jgi:MFS family permease